MILKTWQFGKYKGQPVSFAAHGDYIRWYLDQPENPKYPNLIPSEELVIQGVLRAVRVRPGISDGTVTAVQGELTDNAQVVTGQSATSTGTTTTPSTSPFMPQRPGGNRQNRQQPGGTR